jgi:membrane peptidoglycan carboxypeptidase
LALNTISDFIATASAMGITTFTDPSRYGLSLTLGGGEVKMIDMATAFGVFANSGIRIDLNPLLEVKTYKGEVLEKNDYQANPPAGKRIFGPDVAYIISNILSDNAARVMEFGAHSQLEISGKTVSVKTGTTDDLRDNWTFGYTPEFVTAVWVGNNDNTKMNPYVVSGITGAAPIWHDIMSFILKNRDDVLPIKPENVVGLHVCSYTGDPNLDPSTCNGRFEYYIKGTEKDQLHGRVEKKNTWIDKETKRPPIAGKVDNLELQEHVMGADAFTFDYCLDCPHDNEPSANVNLEQFYNLLKLHQPSAQPAQIPNPTPGLTP